MKKLSPFGFFRDHQRMFLAVFGVVILVVFTVGPSLQSYQSTQGGGGGNAPVVQWNQWSVPYLGKIWIVGKFFRGGESVTENELARLRNMHIMAHNVLDAIRPPIVRATVPPLPYNTGDEYLVNLLLVEDKADELRIVVTDQMIDDYLVAYSNSEIEIKHSRFLNRLEGELGKTLYKTTNGQMTELQFYNQMRRELTFHHVVYRLAASGASDISFPGDLWTLHQRNERNLEIEYLEFEAASYADEISKNPSTAESRLFYDLYRDSLQDPFPFQANHFYPGFRYPEQVDFGYLHIDYQEDFFQPAMETAKATITDEQVQTYYDEHKINYIKIPDEKKSDEKKSDEKKSDEKKSDEKKSDEKKSDATKAKPADQGSRPLKASTNFVSLQAEKAAAPNTDKKDKPADEKDKPADEKDKPADEKDKPADEPEPLIEYRPLKEVRDEIVQVLAEQQARPIAEEKLKTALAQIKRIERIIKVQSAKLDTLRSEGQVLGPDGELQAAPGPENPKIKTLIAELKAKVSDLAAKSNIRIGQTGKITFQDVRDWNEKDPNKETDPEYAALLRAQERRISMETLTNSSASNQQVSFAQMAFQQGLPVFEPFEILQPYRIIGENPLPSLFTPTPNHAFLFWRSDVVPTRTPPWNEIKDEVAKAWKVRQAAASAFSAAEALADTATKGKQSLTEAYESEAEEATKNIKTPPAFTMSSFPFATLQINAEKIEKLFTMNAGETAAFRSAKYIPETGQFKNGNSTYVIRIVSITPDEMELRSDFLRTFLQFRDHTDRNGRPVFGQAPADPNQRIQIGSGWLQDLHDELKVQWNREASRMQR